MRRNIRIRVAFAALPLLMGSTSAFAAVFPDVPPDHIYAEPISALVSADVVKGNPDGLFYPNRPVNRAELLKMLYLAMGKTPGESSVKCFPDVVPGSWYEPYVCDAAADKLVNGYPDGTFKPGQEVNRVESIKMIMDVLGVSVSEISNSQRDVVKFVDVSTAAWYTKYLYAAFAKQILPIAGQEGARFYPDWPLLRGEAAAYIHNALKVSIQEERQESSSSSSATGRRTSSSSSAAAADARTSAAPAEKAVTEVSVDLPFEWNGKFAKKQPFTFLFDIAQNTTTFTDVALQTAGSVSCRLYKLEEGGFSNEYYLGQQDGTHCYIQSALSTGSYQLQIQPTVADATFKVSVVERKGDSNDGFHEAITLIPGVPKSSMLDVSDIQDWYIFSVKSETGMKVELTNSLEIDCMVYPGPKVDLFSFEGPQCNQNYQYPPGAYYISVFRKIASKDSKKTYTIQLR